MKYYKSNHREAYFSINEEKTKIIHIESHRESGLISYENGQSICEYIMNNYAKVTNTHDGLPYLNFDENWREISDKEFKEVYNYEVKQLSNLIN